jgi:hypothetical protein
MSRPARAEYLRRFAAWREQLARDWRRAGAMYSMVIPGAEGMRRVIRGITTPSSVVAVRR